MKNLDEVVFAVPDGIPSVHLEVLDGQVANNVITGGSPGRMLRWAQLLDNVEVFPYEVINSEDGMLPLIRHVTDLSESKALDLILGDRLHAVINGTYKGEKVTLAPTGMGPSTVGIIGMELIRYCNSPDMLILRGGTSGGLSKDLKVGGMIVTKDREYTNDGVSADIVFPEMHPNRQYIAIPDADITDALLKTANEHRLPFQTVYAGRTKTVRELFMTNEKFRKILGDPKLLLEYQAETEEFIMPLAISMEFAVYCALRDLCNTRFGHNIKVGQNLVVSDIVVPGVDVREDRKTFNQYKFELEQAQGKMLLETVLKVRYS